ncbi:hypothetical protein ATANTOWER_019665 [Ataeniobius toweri]|uniref:LITAF domain-containing protein n=1 Tax=Ataeniobius toweri TaxID=208326 RepID=A0ABU7AQE2_9TELE|nr:hypothetical protein [Ataeniobius toweri]
MSYNNIYPFKTNKVFLNCKSIKNKTGFIRSAHILSLICGPVLMLQVLSAVDKWKADCFANHCPKCYLGCTVYSDTSLPGFGILAFLLNQRNRPTLAPHAYQ